MITVPSGGELKAKTRENLMDGGIMGEGRVCAETERKTREGTIGIVTNAITRTRTKMDGPAIITGGIDTTVPTDNAVSVGRRSIVGGQGMRETLNHATRHGHVHQVLGMNAVLIAVGLCEDRTHLHWKTMVHTIRLKLGSMRGLHLQRHGRTDLRTGRTMQLPQLRTPTH